MLAGDEPPQSSPGDACGIALAAPSRTSLIPWGAPTLRGRYGAVRRIGWNRTIGLPVPNGVRCHCATIRSPPASAGEPCVHFPFPRNRVPLSRVCDADSAMAGRGTPAFVGTVGFEPTASRSQSARAAYCAMFRSRRRGESTRTPLRVPSRTFRIPWGTPTLRERCGAFCGLGGGRTRCLRVANATLCQLSYKPEGLNIGHPRWMSLIVLRELWPVDA